MKKTKVYSVRLKSLTEISKFALRAADFNGNTSILPKSAVFGQDADVGKCDAYWIAAWILPLKEINYSTKKEGWFNPMKGSVEPPFSTEIIKHVPAKIEPVNKPVDESLTR